MNNTTDQAIRFLIAFILVVFTSYNLISGTSLYDCQQDNITTIVLENDSVKIGYTPQLDSQVVFSDSILTFAKLDTLTIESMINMVNGENYKRCRPFDKISIDRIEGKYNVLMRSER